MTRHGTYTPQRTKDYEEQIGWAARLAKVPLRSDDHIALSIKFHVKPTRAGTMPKLDIDNLVKAVMDGLHNIAYVDDSQVAAISATKLLAEEGRTEIRLGDAWAEAPSVPDRASP